MDAQLKKGTLEVCVLASLIEGPSYGYKIVKDLKDVVAVSESTLYPILRRLEKGEYLTTHSEEANGRLRKIYEITDEGYEKIMDYVIDFKELLKIYKYIERGVRHD